MTKEGGDLISLSLRPDPGNSDVRTERTVLTAETELMKKPLSLLIDDFNLTPRLANSYPDDIHPLEVRKSSSTSDLKGEWWKGYLCKDGLYFLKF